MARNVTLTEISTYETGRESGERQTSAAGARLVRAHWFGNAGKIDSKDDRLLKIDWCNM